MTLQERVAAALAAKLETTASSLYTHRVKIRTTPGGRHIPAILASVLRTSATGFIGWPTPRSADSQSSGVRWSRGVFDTLTAATSLASWLTPSANDDASGNPGAKMQKMLPSQSKLAGWPTPMAGTPAQKGNNEAGNNDSSRRTVALAGWSTPTAQTQRKSARAMTPSTDNGRRSGGGQSSPPGLEQEAELAHGIIASDVQRSGLPATWPEWTGPARITVSGEMLTGSSAGMESGGQLDPAHSRWLMGLPKVWDECGIAAFEKLKKPSKVGRSGIKETVPKQCETCGTFFHRKILNSGRMEDLTAFEKRRFCSLSCANSQTKGGSSRSAMNVQARKHLGLRCEFCGTSQSLVIHHVDEDWTNNQTSNLQTLCDSCHKSWHITQRYAGVSPAGRMSVRFPSLSVPPHVSPDSEVAAMQSMPRRQRRGSKVISKPKPEDPRNATD